MLVLSEPQTLVITFYCSSCSGTAIIISLGYRSAAAARLLHVGQLSDPEPGDYAGRTQPKQRLRLMLQL